MGMLKSTLEEPIMSEPEAPPPLLIGSPTTTSDDDTERERKELEQNNKSASKSSEEQKEYKWGDKAAVLAATEDKAAKIERLKSGFRICKPQGTFLWPNMAMSPQSSVVHLEDLLGVRTPPSASSTTSATGHLLLPCKPHPASPVKPFAERLPVSNAGILNSVTKPAPSPPPPPETPQTTFKSCVINLNEPPQIQHSDNGFCGTITYQRRHHSVNSDASMPRVSISLSPCLFQPF